MSNGALVEFLLDLEEKGITLTAVFLDYSKAFDCLDLGTKHPI